MPLYLVYIPVFREQEILTQLVRGKQTGCCQIFQTHLKGLMVLLFGIIKLSMLERASVVHIFFLLSFMFY